MWNQRKQVVAQHGFKRTYGRAFTLTMPLYAIGIAALVTHWPWFVAVAYCFLVALPMAAAAVQVATRRV